MKRVPIISFLTAFIFLVLLTSCQTISNPYQNDNNITFNVVNKNYQNFDLDYEILDSTIHVYKDLNNISYLDIKEYFNVINNYYNSSDLNYSVSEFTNSIRIYYFEGLNIHYLTINWYRNNIILSSQSFTDNVVSSIQTDYSRHFELVKAQVSRPDQMVYYLDDYNYEIYYYQKHVLVPFNILNILLNSVNYFNMVELDNSVCSMYTTDYSSIDSDLLSMTYEYNHQELTNFMLFVVDHIYGLDNTNARRYILNNQTRLESSNPLQAIYDTIQVGFNEGHTYLNSYSPRYSQTQINNLTKYNSDFDDNYLQTYHKLKPLQNQTMVRIVDEVAFIYLGNFITGTNSQIYDEDHNKKEDAYLVDTYEYLLKCYEEIVEHSQVEKVVIDASTNGGGNLAAMINALGFISNGQSVNLIYQNVGDKTITDVSYEVDIDLEIPEYDYYILVTNCTFSAANYFTYCAKAKNFAKVVGTTTGGGMCSVLPIILPDGTGIYVSGSMMLKQRLNNELVETEAGLSADIYVDLDHLYDDNYLVSLLN